MQFIPELHGCNSAELHGDHRPHVNDVNYIIVASFFPLTAQSPSSVQNTCLHVRKWEEEKWKCVFIFQSQRKQTQRCIRRRARILLNHCISQTHQIIIKWNDFSCNSGKIELVQRIALAPARAILWTRSIFNINWMSKVYDKGINWTSCTKLHKREQVQFVERVQFFPNYTKYHFIW